MQLTRREAMVLVSAGPGAARQQAPKLTEETPAQLLENARNRLRRNIEALSKVKLPASAEPAFQFRAS